MEGVSLLGCYVKDFDLFWFRLDRDRERRIGVYLKCILFRIDTPVNAVVYSHGKYINNGRISNLQTRIEIHRREENRGLHSAPITLTVRAKGVPVCRNCEPEVECVSVYLINFIPYNMGPLPTLINGIEPQPQKYNPVARLFEPVTRIFDLSRQYRANNLDSRIESCRNIKNN